MIHMCSGKAKEKIEEALALPRSHALLIIRGNVPAGFVD